MRAASARRRPSATHCGMVASSAPASRHSCAAWRAKGSGDLGEQVGPAAGELAKFGHRGSLLVVGEVAPPGAVPSLPGQLSHQNPIGTSC